MKRVLVLRATTLALGLSMALLAGAPSGASAQGSNPCAARANPCNPCAAKNPCNPCAKKANPCGATNPCNPCGAKNPCNPCGGRMPDASKIRQPAGSKLAQGSRLDQLALGEELWNDPKLGTSGVSCGSCHVQVGETLSQMNASFATPYPHRVEMPAQQVGVASVNAAEMVQFCMTAPMATEPLPWDSRELAALTTYVLQLQQGFRPAAANPGAVKGANPCNPCGAQNPCNPCGARR